MTIWILLTLALGAITGTAETPLLRAHSPSTVARSSAVAEQRVSRVVAANGGRIRSARGAIQTAFRDAIRIQAPLTGAAAPRAPASSC
jgi:hypothetical protein